MALQKAADERKAEADTTSRMENLTHVLTSLYLASQVSSVITTIRSLRHHIIT